MPCPVVVGGRKGFCSRAIPGPGPSQKPRTLRVPARKVQLRIGVVLVRRWYPAGSFCAGSATCRLTHSRFGQRGRHPSASSRKTSSLSSLPCWVVPSAKASSPASGPARFCCLHSSVSLRLVFTWSLFRHTSAGMNPAGSVPGAQDTAVPAVGAACSLRLC